MDQEGSGGMEREGGMKAKEKWEGPERGLEREEERGKDGEGGA